LPIEPQAKNRPLREIIFCRSREKEEAQVAISF